MIEAYRTELDLLEDAMEAFYHQPKITPKTLEGLVGKMKDSVECLTKRTKANEALEVSLLSFSVVVVMLRMLIEIKQELV